MAKNLMRIFFGRIRLSDGHRTLSNGIKPMHGRYLFAGDGTSDHLRRSLIFALKLLFHFRQFCRFISKQFLQVDTQKHAGIVAVPRDAQ